MTFEPAQLIALATGLMMVGGVIVKLTPTKKDDEWYQTIVTFVQKLMGK